MERAHVSRLEQERLKREWTREYAAEQLKVDPATLQRWEKGLHLPQPIHRQRIYTLYNKTARELGLEESEELVLRSAAETENRFFAPLSAEMTDSSTAFRWKDLTTRLQSLVWSWLIQKNPNARYHELQTAIILALKQEDNTSMNDEVFSRRDALRRLASLPIDFCGLSLIGAVFVRPIEEIIAHCAAGITACWYLRKSREFAFASDTVSWYVPTLREIVATGSTTQRKDAAELLVQSLLLKATIAKHVTNNTDAIRYALAAEEYAQAAENVSLQVIALRTQASAYSYAGRWERALSAAEKARELLEKRNGAPISQLIRSYIYAGLANYQAYNGRREDALTTLGKAHATFFAHPFDEMVPIWIDHNQENLVLNDGMTHFHLGLQKSALDSFTQIDAIDGREETIHIEALINQVMAEVSRDDQPRDMDICIDRWTTGIQGAIALQSTQWFTEARMAYTAMRAAWPSEQRVKDLRGLIVWPEEASPK